MNAANCFSAPRGTLYGPKKGVHSPFATRSMQPLCENGIGTIFHFAKTELGRVSLRFETAFIKSVNDYVPILAHGRSRGPLALIGNGQSVELFFVLIVGTFLQKDTKVFSRRFFVSR